MATEAKSGPTIRFGNFELDVRSGELSKRGMRLPIQGRPVQALAILLENPGQIVTREEMRKRLWPADTFVDFEHGLHNAIARLREALSDSADTPRFIETLPRRGYRFIASVENLSSEPPVKEVIATAPVRRLWSTLVFIGLVSAIVVAGAWWYWHFQRAQPAPQVHSIAVLPLANLSGDPEQEYFADGMTDELITELAQISSLRVISRTSVMHYKATAKTAPEIAKELNVEAVLEGSVVRSANRVRITAQLIEARADRHLWAGSYEGESRDTLAMQDSVAREVVKQIRLRLTVEEQARLNRARPVNPEAHEAYLRGLYYWNKRTRAGLEKAIEYYQRAIDVDPNYALPYAGLAQCYIGLTYFGYVRGTDAQLKVNAALQKALELDDSLAEAHTALGSAKHFYEYDWQGAEKEFRRAIELNPNYATAHHWYSQMLAAEARNDEAFAELKRALALDPMSLIINSGPGRRLYRLRRYDEAVPALKAALEIDPEYPSTHWNLGKAYVQQKDFTLAIRELRKAESLLQGNALVLGDLAYTYGASGDVAKARDVVLQLQVQARTEYVDPYAFAIAYLGLGDKDKALSWLEKASADRDGQVTFIKDEPMLDRVRSDPRFSQLLRRMGLSP